jgi:adenylate cyclase
MAAIRHRPFLTLYSGGLFVAAWGAIWWLEPYAAGTPLPPHSLTTDLARLSVVGLVTLALFIAVTRARRALIASMIEAGRRANLSRYLSPQLVDELALAGEAARSFGSLKAAILFADLRGFTTLAERMPPGEVAEFLNEYRRRVAEPIHRHHGIIDKFIGDGVMAIFGVPQPGPEDARHAVLGGLALLSAISGWSAERIARGQSPVEIGVGIHYGDVMAGALGDEHRLEYTAIGDTVNVAARVEQLTSDLESPLLVSAEVLTAAPCLERELRFEPLPARFLRGRSRPIQLYKPTPATGLAASIRRGERNSLRPADAVKGTNV